MDKLLEKRHIILDGALGTRLETLIPNDSDIQPKNNKLWSSVVLEQDPKLIKQVHREYLDSGCDIILTSTYQASYETMTKYGKFSGNQTKDLWHRAVEVAYEAVKEYTQDNKKIDPERLKPLIAGAIGPYGASLGNGAEYTGDYGGIGSSYLEDYHFKLLYFYFLERKIPIIALETIPSFKELKVLVNLVIKLLSNVNSKKKIMLSFNFRNASQIADGTQISIVMKYINSKLSRSNLLKNSLIAIGCNCINSELVSSVINNIQKYNELSIPLIVYPNLGFIYSKEFEDYEGYRDLQGWEREVEVWADKGVKFIGGCCSTGPEEIKVVKTICEKHKLN